tara:strand:- start:2467 stop:3978 length:1512 start_codon:yes stop_codon:yes gene_type:complete
MAISTLKYSSISKSEIWKLKDLYKESGPEIFLDTIPLWVTSNPRFASHVARIIVSSILDIIKETPSLKKEPIYIIEGGSGLGCFGFYCINSIKVYLKQLNIKNLSIKFIFTDISKPLCNFWKKNQNIKSLIQSNNADTAILDISQPFTSIKLEYSKETLNLHTLKFPIFFIANYVLSSLPFDEFQIKNNTLFEKKIHVKQKVTQTSFSFKNLKLNYKFYPINSNHYKNSILNKILSEYKTLLSNHYFIFPIKALMLLENLKKQCPNGLIMIASDKGLSKKQHFKTTNSSHLIAHDNFFSSSTNFDTLKHFTELNNGSYIFSNNPNTNFDTYLFSLNRYSLTSTKNYVANSETEANSTNGLLLRKMVRDNTKLTLEECLHCFYLSKYDPEMFLLVSDQLFNQFNTINHTQHDRLYYCLNKINSNIFYQSNERTQTLLVNLGVCFLKLNYPKKALKILHQARKIYPPDIHVFSNLAIIYHHLKKPNWEKKYTTLTKSILKISKKN